MCGLRAVPELLGQRCGVEGGDFGGERRCDVRVREHVDLLREAAASSGGGGGGAAGPLGDFVDKLLDSRQTVARHRLEKRSGIGAHKRRLLQDFHDVQALAGQVVRKPNSIVFPTDGVLKKDHRVFERILRNLGANVGVVQPEHRGVDDGDGMFPIQGAAHCFIGVMDVPQDDTVPRLEAVFSRHDENQTILLLREINGTLTGC
mmetsp:Transcript_31515/g.67683  ORF Transcript_31515/g.67683 Transcript_31515/m.67683 type:complete len:204 (-) Transcript_31515:1086-1697(-)